MDKYETKHITEFAYFTGTVGDLIESFGLYPKDYIIENFRCTIVRKATVQEIQHSLQREAELLREKADEAEKKAKDALHSKLLETYHDVIYGRE